MGCLHADGRERVLDDGGTNFYGSSNVGQVALGGPYAGVVISGGARGCSEFSYVELFDLRTGEQVPHRGGEGMNCVGFRNTSGGVSIDQLVLGSDAVSAVHADGSVIQGCCSTPTEEIQASDSTGVHTLDSATEPDGSPPALTNLTLTGDTLTWNNDGSPRSAQLQP
jgi:hypothetical protein